MKENEGLMVIDKANQDIVFQMLQSGVEKGLDTGTIEKLLDLRERIRSEKAKQLFIEALASFQSELPPIEKDKVIVNKDGSIRNRYASFDKIVTTIKPYLQKYGLSYRFETEFEEKHITIVCIITHIAGHSEKTIFKIPIDTSAYMNPIQQFGSSVTYGKRYALTLALGLATEEDTDGEIEEKTIEIKNDEPATEGQLKAIFAICNDLNMSDTGRKEFASKVLGRKIETFKELTKKEASKLIDELKKKEPF